MVDFPRGNRPQLDRAEMKAVDEVMANGSFARCHDGNYILTPEEAGCLVDSNRTGAIEVGDAYFWAVNRANFYFDSRALFQKLARWAGMPEPVEVPVESLVRVTEERRGKSIQDRVTAEMAGLQARMPTESRLDFSPAFLKEADRFFKIHRLNPDGFTAWWEANRKDKDDETPCQGLGGLEKPKVLDAWMVLLNHHVKDGVRFFKKIGSWEMRFDSEHYRPQMLKRILQMAAWREAACQVLSPSDLAYSMWLQDSSQLPLPLLVFKGDWPEILKRFGDEEIEAVARWEFRRNGPSDLLKALLDQWPAEKIRFIFTSGDYRAGVRQALGGYTSYTSEQIRKLAQIILPIEDVGQYWLLEKHLFSWARENPEEALEVLKSIGRKMRLHPYWYEYGISSLPLEFKKGLVDWMVGQGYPQDSDDFFQKMSHFYTPGGQYQAGQNEFFTWAVNHPNPQVRFSARRGLLKIFFGEKNDVFFESDHLLQVSGEGDAAVLSRRDRLGILPILRQVTQNPSETSLEKEGIDVRFLRGEFAREYEVEADGQKFKLLTWLRFGGRRISLLLPGNQFIPSNLEDSNHYQAQDAFKRLFQSALITYEFRPNGGNALVAFQTAPRIWDSYFENGEHVVQIPLFTGSPAIRSGTPRGVTPTDFDQRYGVRPDARVAVGFVDTGFNYNLPQLQERLLPLTDPVNGKDDDGNGLIDDAVGWNFMENDNRPFDGIEYLEAGELFSISKYGALFESEFHGTSVADLATRGSQALKLVPTRWGKPTDMRPYQYIIDQAKRAGIKNVIINMSFGSESELPELDAFIRSHPEVLFVAAAGNDGQNYLSFESAAGDLEINPHYPAAYSHPNLLTVAAHEKDGSIADFTSYSHRTVLVAAPGVEEATMDANGLPTNFTGTSAAAPNAENVAAKIWAINPNLTPAQIKGILADTAKKEASFKGKTVTEGVIDAEAAFQMAFRLKK